MDILILFFALLALAAVATYQSPEALRWCIMRLSMRVHYIEAGRTAAQIERDRHEVTA
jgi:hypothetical protein